MLAQIKQIFFATAFVAASTSAVLAEDYSGYSCQDLWVARNQIYKDAGYCFKTSRAIRTFGNAGCQYDREGDLPLSGKQRNAIDRIVRLERAYGCGD
eukprot:gene21526-22414_t